MGKRKPAMASKRAHRPRAAAKAQRAAHDVIRSPKDSVRHSVDGGSTEAPPERHDSQEQDDFVEHPDPERRVEKAEKALQEAKPTTDSHSKNGIDFFSANTTVLAYQAKLLEIAQANMQFAFEFAQRLAAIRSPVEYLWVIAEFTSRRFDLSRKHSKALAELST